MNVPILIVNMAHPPQESMLSYVTIGLYAPTSDYDDEEVEAFYTELEKFYKEDHTFYKVNVGDFNAKIGPRMSPKGLHIGTHDASRPKMDLGILRGQLHNDIDHIIFNRKYCQTDDSVKTTRSASLYKKEYVLYKLFTRVILNRISRTLDEGQPCCHDFRTTESTI
ncbi:unnamed protein product [Heligmosomoides polygyrus]|uniref:Craniofacial development protein 2-like n=1 Tax=Heligmosomoides polygyrus TaxID=6339 RepID=A0A183FEG4_HELPZ|nr:unnamed protein product [Heligmosomoides polygyrus]